jgi:hypothetical protein
VAELEGVDEASLNQLVKVEPFEKTCHDKIRKHGGLDGLTSSEAQDEFKVYCKLTFNSLQYKASVQRCLHFHRLLARFRGPLLDGGGDKAVLFFSVFKLDG